MEEMIKVDNVNVYNELRGAKNLHPYISVIEITQTDAISSNLFLYGVYAVIFIKSKCGDLGYGTETYHFNDDTLVFIAPGQVLKVSANNKLFNAGAVVLLFDPELLRGTNIGKNMDKYSFFSYKTSEAIELSEDDIGLILNSFSQIQKEIKQPRDKHSDTILVSHIELLLNYCNRYYERQTSYIPKSSDGLLELFEELIQIHLSSKMLNKNGIPPVSFFAESLQLSANHFGERIKKELGISAQEYIQIKIVEMAKEALLQMSKSISQIAYNLGFPYPQHFSRLFKSKVGLSPSDYRKQFLNRL